MASTTASGDQPKRPGRRANYAKPAPEKGPTRYVPRGWSNWLGFVMFALITIFVLVEIVFAISEGRGADPVMAGIMGCLFAWMTYLFATNRLKD